MSSMMTSCHQYHYILLRWVDKDLWSVSVLVFAVPRLRVHRSERGECVFVKSMRGFYEDCAVNYSCWKVPLLAYNPIVNVLLVCLLDSSVVYAIKWEYIFFINLRWLDHFIYLDYPLQLKKKKIKKNQIKVWEKVHKYTNCINKQTIIYNKEDVMKLYDVNLYSQ